MSLTNRAKVLAMSDTIVHEMQAIVRSAAEPWRAGDSVKAGILRASRKLGIRYRRARTFWYAHQCAVLAGEVDHLRNLWREIEADKVQSAEAAMKRAALRLHDEQVARSIADGAGADLPQPGGSVGSDGRPAADARGALIVTPTYCGPDRRRS